MEWREQETTMRAVDNNCAPFFAVLLNYGDWLARGEDGFVRLVQ